LKCGPILRCRRPVGRHEPTCARSFEAGPVAGNIVSTGEDTSDGWLGADGVRYSVDLKTGKAAVVGKIEGLGGNLGDIAWIDEAVLA
jgi:hypothetical protein